MIPDPYPKLCDLCGYQIESSDDALWWHGYGNCVEITDQMWDEWMAEINDSDLKGD